MNVFGYDEFFFIFGGLIFYARINVFSFHILWNAKIMIQSLYRVLLTYRNNMDLFSIFVWNMDWFDVWSHILWFKINI